MTDSSLQPPTLVANQADLQKMTEQLGDQHLFALDTESDSLFSYYPKVCLIQISVDHGNDERADHTLVSDYLVDPLAIGDMTPLGELLSRSGCEVIMHAADNDLLLLQREFSITVDRLFDTQLAARILGRQKVGLASILSDEFDVISNKRMQRTDWGKRPLTDEQTVYAQKDTHYLLPLRCQLTDELKAAGRWVEAQEAFEQLVNTDFNSKEPTLRSMWQMKETKQVQREDLGVLDALWEWREKEAQRRDTPPFKVLRNQELAAIAIEQPTHIRGFEATPSVGKSSVQRYGRQLVQVVRDGQDRPIPDFPEPTVRPDYTTDKRVQSRYDSLRKWRTQTAEERGVAPEIVLTNGTLMEIAKRQPRSVEELQKLRDIGPWKAETYGPAILKIVTR